MSQLGQKLTSARSRGMSTLPSETDIVGLHAQVRFVPKADMGAIAARQLSILAQPGSGRRFKVMLRISLVFDDHLNVYRLLLFNDEAPEACRSLAS
jgi:hypothetical protein